jgi:hypothetical protein
MYEFQIIDEVEENWSDEDVKDPEIARRVSSGASAEAGRAALTLGSFVSSMGKLPIDKDEELKSRIQSVSRLQTWYPFQKTKVLQFFRF